MVRSWGSICESQELPTFHVTLKDCCETEEYGSDLTVEDNFWVHMKNDRLGNHNCWWRWLLRKVIHIGYERVQKRNNLWSLPWGTSIWLARAGLCIRCLATRKYFNTNNRRMQKVTEKVSDADECHCGIFPYPFPHLGLNSQWALNKDRDAWICYLGASLGGRIKGELINTVETQELLISY